MVRGRPLRGRIAKFGASRRSLPDGDYYLPLQLPTIDKNSAISVRATISDAVRIPKELIDPEDAIADLERIGDLSHPSTADYFEDIWSVPVQEDNFRLLTVRDFVIRFGTRAG